MDIVLIVALIASAAIGALALITRRSKIESRLHAMATVGRVAVGMAHDLNNLLTVIIGQAELLKRDHSLSHVKTASDEIRELCECAGRMTQYVLSLVHPNCTEVQKVDAAAHIRDLETVLETISGPAAQLRINVNPASVGVQIPPSDIDQLLVNLVLNAREAGAAKIRIEVTTGYRMASDGCWLNIEVVDDGQGMSELVLARATEEQFSENKPSGTGIGLSTVKRIVDATGGFLELKNAASGGVIARIALPCVTQI